MKLDIESKVKPLLDWDPKTVVPLMSFVFDSRLILQSRLRTAAGHHARMHGFAKDDIEISDDIDIDPEGNILGKCDRSHDSISNSRSLV